MASSFLEEDIGIEDPGVVGSVKGVEDPPPADPPPVDPPAAAAPAEPGAPAPDDNPPDGFEGDWNDPKDKARWTAVSDERSKRREAVERSDKLEKEVEFMKGQISAMQRGGNGDAAPGSAEPSDAEVQKFEEEFLADPYGMSQKIAKDAAARARVDAVMHMSAVAVAREHDDFQEVADEFDRMKDEDPSLWAEMTKQPDPARWAYNFVKRQRVLADHDGDPAKMLEAEREKMRAELKQEILQEVANQSAAGTPPSPASAGASGGTTPATVVKDLDDAVEGNVFD